MMIRIRRIATRFALLMALAAVVPLVAYGVASMVSLQRGTRDTIVTGHMNVAERAGEEIRRYIATNAELLKGLAADLEDTGLTPMQQELIARNYVRQFPEVREVTLVDERGSSVVPSRIRPARVRI